MISIIVPTYNRPDQLFKALASIGAQKWPDFEAIVVNDGGQDVSPICRRFDFATYLEHAANCGLGAARNTGIRASRGEWIAYLDDDDRWDPSHLDVLMANSEGSHFLYTDARYDDGITIRIMPSLSFSRAGLLQHNLMPVCCVMHSRWLIQKVGLFDESLVSHEDYELWLRMAGVVPFKHIEVTTATVNIRQDPGRISCRRDMFADRTMIQKRYMNG